MVKISITKSIIKDIVIIAIGVVIIWIGLQVAFGTQNPFYVVASGSMIPELQVYDVLVVQGHESFEDLEIGDIIVFNRPSDHNRVIVHRVVSVIDDEPRTLRTKGDANSASIPGTDFPITDKEYIGKVVYTLPQIGYITQLLKPPVNYIIIAVVIGIMIAKQMMKKKPEKELSFADTFGTEDSAVDGLPEGKEFAGVDVVEKDAEYSRDAEKDDEYAGADRMEKDDESSRDMEKDEGVLSDVDRMEKDDESSRDMEKDEGVLSDVDRMEKDDESSRDMEKSNDASRDQTEKKE